MIMIQGLIILSVSLSLTIGCFSKSDDDILVRYGDDVIRVDEFQRLYQINALDGDSSFTSKRGAEEIQKRQMLDELVNHKLLLGQARRQGIEIDVDQLHEHLGRMRRGYDARNFQEQLSRRGLSVREWEEMQQERFLIGEWIRQTIMPALRLTSAEIKTYYQEHNDEFVVPERVRALQIVVPKHEEAEEIRKRLAAGDDFATLAKELSHGPEADRGGDLGYFSRDETLPLFAETCFDLSVGGISDIVASDYGFHIFKVVDKKRSRKKALGEVEEDIRQRLYADHVRKTLQQYIADLRGKIDISINEKLLMEVR